jgi:hypothetical protein
LRDAFLAANAQGRVPYDGPAEEATKLAALAQAMGNALVVRAIEILGQAIIDIRQQTVADPRLVLEVAVVRVTRREARTSVETLFRPRRRPRLRVRLRPRNLRRPVPSSRPVVRARRKPRARSPLPTRRRRSTNRRPRRRRS